jgi:hypothetical protein
MTSLEGASTQAERPIDTTSLPVFDLGIDTHDADYETRLEAWGRINTHRFLASDGTEYRLNTYIPDNPRADLLPVTYTTPWCTDLAGFNDHIGSLLAQEGAHVIAVSPEQIRFTRAIRHLGRASLAHDAKVHHLMLDQLGERAGTDFTHIANIGYSRGAMVGFALQAYAAQHGREQTYNDYTDPCLEHSVFTSVPQQRTWRVGIRRAAKTRSDSP